MAERDLLHPEVRSKLDRFRAALRARLAGEGVAWGIIFLVSLMFASLVLDYLFRLDRPLRVALTASALVVLGYVLWRQLIAPMLVGMDTESLALLAEQKYPQLGDRLISALQFSRTEQAGGWSQAMVDRMAEQANEIARPLDLRQIIEKRLMMRTLGGAGLAAVVAVLFVLLAPNTAGLWFQRNVLFAQVDWPQDTYLVVTGADENGNFTVLRGEDLQVVIEVEPNSVAPAYITLHAEYETVGETEERLDLASDGPGGVQRYVKTFQAVSEEFEFYVVGGDDNRDRRNPHKVFIIDPPTLEQLQFEIEYPRYMFRANQPISAEVGVIPVPVGSHVVVRGLSSKPLEKAGILLDDNDEPVGKTAVLPYKEKGGKETLRRIESKFYVGGANEARTRKLRFLLVDSEGNRSTRGQQYMLQLQRDQRPSVTAKRSGVETLITTQAQIPLSIKVTDDHGIDQARVTVKVGDEEAVAVDEPLKPKSETQKEFREDTILDLQTHPELKLVPGTLMHVIVEAEDNFPENPNVGKSSPINFRVVGDSELMNHLLSTYKNAAVSLGQAVVSQSDATGKTGTVSEFLQANEVDAEVRRKLTEAGQIEGSVASEVIKCADQVDTVLVQMRLNRLGSDDQRSQLASQIRRLRALEEPLRQVVAALNGTKDVSDSGQLAARAGQIRDEQQKILDEMVSIHDEMKKNTSRIEMAYVVKDILKVIEGEVGTGIRRIIDKETGDIWEPEINPSDKDK
ncbi:MAG: hypothetical protein ACLFV7_03595 [Phycisphaerae bacterium]